ncbi:hypothetical protein A0J59_20105 [Cellulosimicrobium sp. I38E]|nr:hypothetical protein A0J59_20105 [Cellulosimicrobium sp. I38E]
MRTHGGQPVARRQGVVEAGEEGEARAGAVDHGDRDRAVERDVRARVEALEHQVEREDPLPVRRVRARCLRVQRRDRRLHLVRPDEPVGERRGDDPDALDDLGVVPAGPVLLGERHELAARAGPGAAPGVREEHEREQPRDLRVVRQQRVHRPGQADRLAGQVRAPQVRPRGRRVALGEHDVEDAQDRGEPRVPLARPRGRERAVERGEAPLRARDALGHGRLGDAERTGDLRRREPTDGPQRQRDGARGRQVGVAAEEEEGERVVDVTRSRARVDLSRHLVGRDRRPRGPGRAREPGRGEPRRRRVAPRRRLLPTAPRDVGPDRVHEPAFRDAHEPGPRVVGDPVRRPAGRGREQRLLERVLGVGEVAATPDEEAEDARPEVPQQVLDRLGGRGGHAAVTARTRVRS